MHFLTAFHFAFTRRFYPAAMLVVLILVMASMLLRAEQIILCR